ncbi:DUF2156 domain-containing protein [Candidatus Woesearchaeota archaeon]|nr:DUF2156 domain-containing protein [Candidatus Woesearchaeota archaeon]
MKEKLKKFSIKDKKIFYDTYSKLKFPLAENSFYWLLLWKDCYKEMKWTKINNNLCLFLKFEGKKYVWGPILPGNKLENTLEKCQEILKNSGKEGDVTIMYIPEELKKDYEKLEGYVLIEQNQDYIYERGKIIGLKGDNYKSKRNLGNYFLNNYKNKVEEYDKEKHLDGCKELLETWKKQKLTNMEGGENSLEYEYLANLEALNKVNEFNLKGITVYVDGKVQGYSFGERTNGKMCTCFFEKTNLDIKGLSVFIYGEFLKLFDCELVNAGEDWGIEYLKQIKMSYHPDMIKKGYSLKKIDKKL